MRARLIAPLMAALVAGTVGLTAGTASAAPAAPAAASHLRDVATISSAPVTGTTTDGQTLVGTFTPTRFTGSHGVLSVVGTVTGTLGGQPVSTTATLPVTAAPAAAPAASCSILNLTLGPLDLNLLGLVVHLDTVHLVITAVPGAGNLLGNLLCSLAGLLDGTGAGGLAGLLNRLLMGL